jgi:hypothetical protein
MIKNRKHFSNSLVLVMLFVALFGGIYGVNFSNKLAVCSPFFVSSLLITLIMAKKFDTKVTWATTLLCITLNMAVCWPSFRWVHIFSFIGILGAVHVSTRLFSILRPLTSLPMRVFASLSCGVIIDAVAMLPWEIYTFTSPRLWDVISRSVFYKFSYVFLVSLCLGCIYVYKNKRETKYKIAAATNS